jgi:HSP20 family protein
MVNEDNQLIVHASVPGVEPKDIDLSIADNILTIKGETTYRKQNGKDKKEKEGHSFFKRIQLPLSVDSDKITAKVKHGILTITLPKSKESKARKIVVGEGAGATAL